MRRVLFRISCIDSIICLHHINITLNYMCQNVAPPVIWIMATKRQDIESPWYVGMSWHIPRTAVSFLLGVTAASLVSSVTCPIHIQWGLNLMSTEPDELSLDHLHYPCITRDSLVLLEQIITIRKYSKHNGLQISCNKTFLWHTRQNRVQFQ